MYITICVHDVVIDRSAEIQNGRRARKKLSDRQTNCNMYSQCPRELTDEERTKLEKDTNFVSDFKRDKLEKEAVKNWDLFYKRNSTNFFKDRHWTTREFQELLCDGVQVCEILAL